MSSKSTKTLVQPYIGGPHDPYMNRNAIVCLSPFQSFVLIFKCSIGLGFLTIPQYFYWIGLPLGIVCLCICAAIHMYSMCSLSACRHYLCIRHQVPILTYQQTVRAALDSGPELVRNTSYVFIQLIDGILITYYVTLFAVYIKFMGDCIRYVSAQYEYTAFVSRLPLEVVVLVPSYLMVSQRNPKTLMPLMYAGLAGWLAAMVIWLVIISESRRADVGRDGESRDYGMIAKFMMHTFFSLESAGLVVFIDAWTQDPIRFRQKFGVLNLSACAVVLCYAAIGFYTYQYIPDGSFFLSMHRSPNTLLAHICIALFYLSILLNLGIYHYVPFDLIWNCYMRAAMRQHALADWCESLVCYALPTVACLIAIGIPDLILFASLVSTLALSLVTFTLPGIIEFCVRYPDAFGRWRLRMFVDLFMIGFGLVFHWYWFVEFMVSESADWRAGVE